MLKLTVRYFAQVRELLGEQESFQWLEDEPGAPSTVGELRQWLIKRSDLHAQALDQGVVLRAALNQVMCSPHEPLQQDAEVAFFPPVTGG